MLRHRAWLPSCSHSSTRPDRAVAALVLGSEGPFARLARAGMDDRRQRLAARELDALGQLAHIGRGIRARVARTARCAGRWQRRCASPTGVRGASRGARSHRRAGASSSHGSRRSTASRARASWPPTACSGSETTGWSASCGPIRSRLPISREARRSRRRSQAISRRSSTGDGANDALLYGPPGTGKSATVRGLASVFADRGLRLVQVDRG